MYFTTDTTMNSEDSENLLRQKFTIAGLSYCYTEGLKTVFDDLLEKALIDFNKEISSKYKLSDFFSKNKGEEILEVYKTYFSLKEEYKLESFLSNFQNPTQLNISWAEKQIMYIIQNYDGFEEIFFDEKNRDLLKEYYFINVFYPILTDYEKSYLTRIFPKYFSNRQGDIRKNQRLRKIISMKSYMEYLTDNDRYDILSLKLIEVEERRTELANIGRYNRPELKMITIIEELLKDLRINEI